MNWIRPWFQKLLAFLRIRSMVAGLDISDEMIRLAYFDGSLWQMHAIRLSPGTMENGKMKDRAAFLAAMSELRMQSNIAGHDKTKKIDVVVALSSANAYSKVFRLPIITGESLEKAIALNLEMASPSDAKQVYSSSQIVGHDDASGQLDVLAAFMDRTLVDDIVDALFAIGFIAIAVEPRSLALMRVFREKGSGIDITKSYVMVSIDNAGLEFFIVRNGVPYFEYVNHWRDIANEKGELSLPALEEDLKVSLRQVLNFYAQHWPEPIAAIILSNTSFPEEVEKTIAANFAFPVVRLTLLMGQPISSEWLTGLGSSLRETGLRVSKVKEISFLGVAMEDRFRVDQMVRFLEFWRAVFPASLAVLVAAFFILNIYLVGAKAAIESGPGFTLIPAQSADLAELEASTTAFNSSVSLIGGLENSAVSQATVLGDIAGLAAANGVAISHLTVTGPNVPITLSATATSEDHISSFKTALSTDPKVSEVDLPLTGIQATPDGYSFSVTFVYRN
jgi:hypothetical protein